MFKLIKQKKHLSQIFLVNHKTLSQISKLTHKHHNIIEIGPGTGNLTNFFLSTQKKYLIEIDTRITKLLFSHIKNVRLKNYDAVNILAIEEEINNYFNGEHYCLVGNLPYSVSSNIIQKCLQLNKWSRMIFTLESGVVERLTNHKKSCYFSTLVACYGTIKKFFSIKKNNFEPQPSCDSTVVEIFRHDNEKENKYCHYQNQDFFNFLQMCFTQPRKTLTNNLLIRQKKLNKKQIDGVITNKVKKIIIQLNKSLKVRSEKLTVDEFISLYKSINSEKIVWRN